MNYSISFKTLQRHCKHKFLKESWSEESIRKGQGKYGCQKLILYRVDLTTDEIHRHPKFPLSPNYNPKLTMCKESNCPVVKRLQSRPYNSRYYPAYLVD